jgi:glycosyltransferase involved in cell wall biosynthesis
MRIAMIGSRGVPAGSGGIEKIVERLGGALARRGHDVTVFCRSNYIDYDGAEYDGMRLRVLPTIGTKHLDAIVHTALSTTQALSGYDVLHYHALGPGLLTPLPRVLARDTAVVQTVHALDWQRAKWGRVARGVLRAGEWVSTKSPQDVIVVAADLVEYYEAEYGFTPTLIPNPVETVIEHQPAGTIGSRFGLEPQNYLLFIGRLTPEKQIDVLLRAYKLVDSELPLVIVGGSSFTDNYVAHLNRLASEDSRVIMAGELFGETLTELLTNARAFVSPSALEGSPSTVLEAISAGVPIVASEIAPHVELLGAATGGCMLHEVGSEIALAAAIEEVISDHASARIEMTRSRSHLLTGRSAGEVAERTEEVYIQALDQRRGR